GHINDGEFAQRVRALRGRKVDASIWGLRKHAMSYRIYVTDDRGIVVFDSDGRDIGKDYSRWNDVYLTLRGGYGARSTSTDPNDDTSSVMYVAAPLHDARGHIIGVLTVAKPNRAIAPVIARSQAVVIRWGALLLGVALLIGLVAAWWLSRQLGGLRRYAHAVTAGERASLPKAVGEFDDLGRALETMRNRLEGKQYVEQYVHTLTHEMKSPLAAIRGSAELLEEAHGDQAMADADRARFAASIRLQSDRLAQMIDKLLALASVEHRQRLENPEPLDLIDVVHAASEQCASRLGRSGLKLSIDVPKDLPQFPGDAFLLRQALVNMIENAADFSQEGGEITLRVQSDASSVCFEVGDRGPGVPDYALPRVFERFYSLPRPEGGSRSSGLGLCFVAEVAALHEGRAALHNREGGGATASLELPVRMR
ncbi:MAG TPA: two-component system sensor histidine kinase CreC, partial [Lysobacter sp.]|nr:two-component system sensor histidine kinase CreC [Lysobacter sp.]